MKKIYVKLGAVAAVLLMVFCLMACEETVPSGAESREAVVAGGYDSEVYAKKLNIGKHAYIVVYTTCDGRPGETVHKCKKIHGGDRLHCFLRHSPDCPCQKAGHQDASIIEDEATESTDPFDW